MNVRTVSGGSSGISIGMYHEQTKKVSSNNMVGSICSRVTFTNSKLYRKGSVEAEASNATIHTACSRSVKPTVLLTTHNTLPHLAKQITPESYELIAAILKRIVKICVLTISFTIFGRSLLHSILHPAAAILHSALSHPHIIVLFVHYESFEFQYAV